MTYWISVLENGYNGAYLQVAIGKICGSHSNEFYVTSPDTGDDSPAAIFCERTDAETVMNELREQYKHLTFTLMGRKEA